MKKAALVLSGGGSLGAAHIGALRVLEQQYDFDFSCGVSAGAIVAAAVACGKKAAEISEILAKQKFFNLAFDFSKNNFGLLRGEKILKLLQEFLGERTFAELPKKLVIGATDFENGERVLITSGDVAIAVRASLAVPVLFEPVRLQNRWLVDGGLTQNLPLDIALEEYQGAPIFAIDVGSCLPPLNWEQKNKIGKFLQMRRLFERSIRIMMKSQQHFPQDSRVKLICPHVEDFTTLDLDKLQEIEAAGERAARETLGNL